jgi:hypothetical protein
LFPGELEGLKIGEPEFLLFALPLKANTDKAPLKNENLII